MALATSLVRRSWICSLRLNISAIRGSFDIPITAFAGIYPMCIWFEELVRVHVNDVDEWSRMF